MASRRGPVIQQGEPVRRLALLVEYEGTAYGGSQYQKNAPTIQDSLERALSSLTNEPIRIALAGRTDAGVHARGQVAAFVAASRHSPETFTRALNALLPEDVSVRAVVETPLTFDPRRQAVSRLYRYTIATAGARSALGRRLVWQLGQPLDEGAMSEAAAALLGGHDFAAFTRPSEARRRCTERVVIAARVDGRKGLTSFDIEANAFLQQMVRRLVGALVEVGLGKRTPDEFGALLREARPGAASLTAPALGLCLIKVRYESGMFDNETD
ncbi:MAG: tRNA pseudouridine(38-40) synthase TruA [Dehalococcoidia bacterium]